MFPFILFIDAFGSRKRGSVRQPGQETPSPDGCLVEHRTKFLRVFYHSPVMLAEGGPLTPRFGPTWVFFEWSRLKAACSSSRKPIIWEHPPNRKLLQTSSLLRLVYADDVVANVYCRSRIVTGG